jgi:hypothetical protein
MPTTRTVQPAIQPVCCAGIPRRCRVDLMVPAELAIRAAKLAVEEAGAHVHLTEAVILLSQAQEKVADFVDESVMGALLSLPDESSAEDVDDATECEGCGEPISGQVYEDAAEHELCKACFATCVDVRDFAKEEK